MPTRKAEASWEGGLQGGKGSFKGESGAIQGSYSFGSRFGEAGGTNPEELLAAAEAACFSMALAANLEKEGTPAERVSTSAACSLEKQAEGFKITTMKLTVRGRVPGIDAETFSKAAQRTSATCPVSQALAGVRIEVESTLE